MTERNIILIELNELGSMLVNANSQNIYSVPEGYFEGLANQVMDRIKAFEASNAKEELEMLSPLLTQINRDMPYTIPAGYFEGLEEKIMQSIRGHADYQTAGEELDSLSPLLKSISKNTPYQVPEGYFESLGNGRMPKPATKSIVISITSRRWFRYAAAAVVTGILVVSGILLIYKNSVDPIKDPYAWVKKNTKKISDDEINNVINLANTENLVEKGSLATNDTSTEEIKELMKDVPENEIQNFLNETAALEDNGEEVLLN